MEIIPVIDLLHGQVVRGVAGKRSEYRPLVSRLTTDNSPAGIARVFKNDLGLQRIYVADLDAIAGRQPNWDAYQAILITGLELWLDAGCGTVALAKKLLSYEKKKRTISRIVLGLESIASEQTLWEVAETVGPERAVFSLDLKAGQSLAGSGWKLGDPLDIAHHAVLCGIKQMIVLDLAQVGVAGGSQTGPLLRNIHAKHPNVKLIGGGGVRGVADLEQLARAGASMALVASALHDLTLGPAEIERAAGL